MAKKDNKGDTQYTKYVKKRIKHTEIHTEARENTK